MGADRLKDKKDQAKRGWDRAGQRLTQPIQLSLFDADPIFGRRSFRIALRDSEFLVERPEFEAISFEFITGPGYPSRVGWHVKKLIELSTAVVRPLQLVVRGGTNPVITAASCTALQKKYQSSGSSSLCQ
jgi:hypothetical protein